MTALATLLAVTLAASPPGPWGVVVHTYNHGDALRDLGAQWVRIDVRWPAVDAHGVPDLKPLDALLGHSFDRGLHVIAILSIEPLPAAANPEAEAARLAGLLATHFAERGVLWELGNEPEGTRYRDPLAYTRVARAMAAAIHHADARASICAPSTAWMDRSFLLRALDAGLLSDGTIDTVSYHGYHRPQLAAESGIVEDVQWLREVIAKYAPAGKRIHLIDTERGYAIVGENEPKVWSDWRNEVRTESEQAAYLARHYLESIHAGVETIVWYKDMFGERSFSLFYADEHDPRGLRPMGRVYRNLAHLLPDAVENERNDRYEVALSNDLVRTSDPNTLLVVRSYLRQMGDHEELIVALWNPIESAQGQVLAERHREGDNFVESWRPQRPEDAAVLSVQLLAFGVKPARVRTAYTYDLLATSPETARKPLEVSPNGSALGTARINVGALPTIVVFELSK